MDALFVAIVATFSVSGCFKGLVKSFGSLVAFFIAVIFAFYITKSLVPILEANNFFKTTLNAVSQIAFNGLSEDFFIKEFSSKQEMIAFIKDSNITNLAKENFVQIVDNNNFEGRFTVFDIVSSTIQKNILSVGVFALVLLIIYVVLKSVTYLITRVVKIHFFIFTNRVAGFIFGAILGIIICLTIIQVLLILSSFLNLNDLYEKLMQSEIALNYYNRFGVKLLSVFI